MREAVELIVQNAARYPEFRYYISIMKKAERNLSNQPDICIETCKALLEGISKSVIERLDSAAIRRDLDKAEVVPLVKQAVRLLKKADNVIEDDFVSRCCSLAFAMATLRNERGDISHGRAVPKLIASNDRLSKLSLSMTTSIICYMLDAFYTLDIGPSLEKDESRSSDDQQSHLPTLLYEDQAGFNDWLDETHPLEGRLVYSKALFDLYYEDYVIQLEEFRENVGGAQ